MCANCGDWLHLTFFEVSSLVNLHALQYRLELPLEASGERNVESLQGWIRLIKSIGRPVAIDDMLK